MPRKSDPATAAPRAAEGQAPTLRYIADMATELRTLALETGTPLLAHLLALVAAEAQERLAEGLLQKRSETRPAE